MKVRINSEEKHGTATEYRSYGCRCRECKMAHRILANETRARARAKFRRGEVKPPHGTMTTYIYYGCRCEKCKRVHSSTTAANAHRKKEKAAA